MTSKIIAMGFPGRGSGACFRNPQKEASFTGMDNGQWKHDGKMGDEDGGQRSAIRILLHVASRCFCVVSTSRILRRFSAEILQVRRFLHWAHRGSFRVYNLCAERSFRENGFEETVCFPCVDHCPPDFADILAFCRDVEAGCILNHFDHF